MLMKLTTGLNFPNLEQTTFAPISFRQKIITNSNCLYNIHFVVQTKMLVKLTPVAISPTIYGQLLHQSTFD